MHRPSPEDARQRSAASVEVIDAISRVLRKMYECEQVRPLPDRLARLLSEVDGEGSRARERNHGTGGGSRVGGAS